MQSRFLRNRLVPTLEKLIGLHRLGPNLGGDAFHSGIDTRRFNDRLGDVYGVDWGDGADFTAYSIITNHKVEPVPELKSATDLATALKQMQAEIEKACREQPEWFVHAGRLYRNTKEGVITYAFNP